MLAAADVAGETTVAGGTLVPALTPALTDGSTDGSTDGNTDGAFVAEGLKFTLGLVMGDTPGEV